MRSLALLSVMLFCGAAFAQADQSPLSRLLLSGAWCSFSYNKTSGYSKTTRYEFLGNGTYRQGRRGEGGSSGPYGSIASQSGGRGVGRWGVQNGVLFMAEGYGQMQPVRTQVYTNSAGNPIIKGDGIEYSRCQ
jgi:hypothetical protein